MAATASSANQVASKSTIAPGINFVFMAISRIIRVLALDLAWFARTGQGKDFHDGHHVLELFES